MPACMGAQRRRIYLYACLGAWRVHVGATKGCMRVCICMRACTLTHGICCSMHPDVMIAMAPRIRVMCMLSCLPACLLPHRSWRANLTSLSTAQLLAEANIGSCMGRAAAGAGAGAVDAGAVSLQQEGRCMHASLVEPASSTCSRGSAELASSPAQHVSAGGLPAGSVSMDNDSTTTSGGCQLLPQSTEITVSPTNHSHSIHGSDTDEHYFIESSPSTLSMRCASASLPPGPPAWLHAQPPPARVVVLSPDAPSPLPEGPLDPAAVYVVGGIVDRTVRKGVSAGYAVRM